MSRTLIRLACPRACARAKLRAQQVVFTRSVFPPSRACTHGRGRRQAGVLRALPTPDLIYKWNNGGIMWRGEKRSDSSTLLIRMMVLASCHKHRTTETTPDSKKNPPKYVLKSKQI